MKVYIGPYKPYFGIYDLTHLLRFVGVSDDKCFEIGEKLDHTWLGELVRRLNDIFGDRKIKVRIDEYDTWSMDHTLAVIVLPMLKQLKETKHGSGPVDNEDVPEHLRSTTTFHVEDGTIDEFYHDRWDWALGEMIWAFEQIVDDHLPSFALDNFDMKAYKEHSDRMKHGLMMFGKYYQSLWD